MIQVTNRHNVRFNALYVSSSGNNTSGNGSIANPYKTLEKAYQMADNTATVYVMNNLTLSDTFNMGTNKNITITSCTKESDTSCPTSTANKITRGSSLTNEMIDVENGSLSLNTITMDGNNVSATRPLIYTKKNVSLNTRHFKTEKIQAMVAEFMEQAEQSHLMEELLPIIVLIEVPESLLRMVIF